jgi:hypothetical protein
MADRTDLQQMVDDAWAYAHQARHYAREARLWATHTMQEVQHAFHQASMAYLQLSMPEANPLTLTITATLLAGHGLLDEKPTVRPPRPATGGRR